MVKIYAKLIIRGAKQLADVPATISGQVTEYLILDGYEDLIAGGAE